MRILAVDTSSFPASVAVSEDGVTLGEYIIRNKRKHSQNLMAMTGRLFSELEMDIADIDIFAVTVGPGSFTGLRIGISTVRAFAQALDKPVVGVSTLEALAYNHVSSGSVVVPMLDARKDEVFCAAYEFDGTDMKELLSPCVMTVGELTALYPDRRVIYTGDGMLMHKDEMTRDNAVFAPANLSEVRAGAAAALAAKRAGSGGAVNHNRITPVYLRKSQAERLYKEKN